MKPVKFSALAVLIVGAVLSVSSCKKTSPSVDPVVSNNDNLDPVNVLNEASGFSHVYDDVKFLSSATAASPSMGVLDYTLESNGNLNIAYYSSTPLQQSVQETNVRVTKNLNSSEMVPLPAGASKLEYNGTTVYQDGKRSLVLQMFRPYSNFFTYAGQFQGSFGYNNACKFEGDIDCSISSANPIGTPDMGYRFPCMNFSTNANDNGFGYFAQGVPNPTYTLSGTSIVPFGMGHSTKIYNAFLESDVFTYGSYKAFVLRADSMIAYNISNDASQRSPLTGVAMSGLSGNFNFSTLRHYSTNGKVLGLLFQNTDTKHFWTVSYDFTTGIMTKGLEDAALEYSGAGTDYDLDEFGNIYYTGYAANGSNTAGVSVYKKSTGGGIALVGKDNFLKFGEVVKLKTLMGKVFLAVTGKKTNTSNYQFSILKED